MIIVGVSWAVVEYRMKGEEGYLSSNPVAILKRSVKLKKAKKTNEEDVEGEIELGNVFPEKCSFEDATNPMAKTRWKEAGESQGSKYYVDEISGRTTWSDHSENESQKGLRGSRGGGGVADIGGGAEEGGVWTRHTAEDGRVYLFNEESGATKWEDEEDEGE